MNRLSLRMQKFCELYVATGGDVNMKQACIEVGYKSEGKGRKLLRRQDVQNYIAELRSKEVKKCGITLDKIVQEYAKIAFFDLRMVYNEDGSLKDIKDFDDAAAACISEIEVKTYMEGDSVISTNVAKVKMRDKIAALDRLREALGFVVREQRVIRDGNGNIIQTEESQLARMPIVFK